MLDLDIIADDRLVRKQFQGSKMQRNTRCETICLATCHFAQIISILLLAHLKVIGFARHLSSRLRLGLEQSLRRSWTYPLVDYLTRILHDSQPVRQYVYMRLRGLWMRDYTPKEKARIAAGALTSVVIVGWLIVLAGAFLAR
jgi:hypothetical protein